MARVLGAHGDHGRAPVAAVGEGGARHHPPALQGAPAHLPRVHALHLGGLGRGRDGDEPRRVPRLCRRRRPRDQGLQVRRHVQPVHQGERDQHGAGARAAAGGEARRAVARQRQARLAEGEGGQGPWHVRRQGGQEGRGARPVRVPQHARAHRLLARQPDLRQLEGQGRRRRQGQGGVRAGAARAVGHAQRDHPAAREARELGGLPQQGDAGPEADRRARRLQDEAARVVRQEGGR